MKLYRANENILLKYEDGKLFSKRKGDFEEVRGVSKEMFLSMYAAELGLIKGGENIERNHAAVRIPCVISGNPDSGGNSK